MTPRTRINQTFSLLIGAVAFFAAAPTSAQPVAGSFRELRGLVSPGDTIYVTDSESGPDTGAREIRGIRKGIRIGSARDGSVTAFIEDMESTTDEHSGAEGVGVDAQGNVYGAVVRRRMLERHVKK